MITRPSALVLSSLFAVGCTIAACANAENFLFVNGELITMMNERTMRAELRVQDGRIAEIGESLSRGNATVIDLAGCVLCANHFLRLWRA